MLKTINGVRLVWFDETMGPMMASRFNQWRHDPKYQEFFRSNPTGDSIAKMIQALVGKTFLIYHDGVPSAPLGLLMFFNLDEWSRHVDVGILLDETFQNRGVARDALKIGCDYLFNTLNLYKVCIKVMKNNERLNRTMKRFGALFEGYSIRHQFLDGEFHDISNWAIFKRSFNETYKDHFLNKDPGISPVAPHGVDLNGQRGSPTIETISRTPVRLTGTDAVDGRVGEHAGEQSGA